ncbi:MAG: hypothetical protein WBP45_03335 [Daejeonella sp.]
MKRTHLADQSTSLVTKTSGLLPDTTCFLHQAIRSLIRGTGLLPKESSSAKNLCWFSLKALSCSSKPN